MSLPEPVPGLVLRYSYLWHWESAGGRDEGRKDRPCAVVAAIRRVDAGKTCVLLLPVTHAPPRDPEHAVAIPLRVKQRLGLDDAASWIVLTEWNEFLWPGPDLLPVPGADDGTVAYGMLPPTLFETVRQGVLALSRHGALRRVTRT